MQKLNLCDMCVGTVGSDGEYDMECYLPADEQTLFTNFYGEPVVCKVSELTEDALRLTGGGEGMDGKCILFLLKPDYLPENLNGTLTITVTTNMNTYSIPFKALADLT